VGLSREYQKVPARSNKWRERSNPRLTQGTSEKCGAIRKWNKEPSVVQGAIQVRGGVRVEGGAIRGRQETPSVEHGAIREQHRSWRKERGAIRELDETSSIARRAICERCGTQVKARSNPQPSRGSKVSAYGAIRRPARRAKRRTRSNP